MEGTSQSDPPGPLISVNQVETHKSPLKSDVSESRVLHGSLAGSTVELEVRGNSSLLQRASSPTCSAQNQWTDEVILYFTLVADKVVPDGFLFDFLHLSQWISSASHRQASRLAHVTDVEAALFVHSEQVKIKDQALEQKAAVDTFVAAASCPPTRYTFCEISRSVCSQRRRGVGETEMATVACKPHCWNGYSNGEVAPVATRGHILAGRWEESWDITEPSQEHSAFSCLACP